MSSHSRGSLQIQEHESLILPLLWMLPFPGHLHGPYLRHFPACSNVILSRGLLPQPPSLICTTPCTHLLLHFFSNSPDCLLIYCTICTYFLSLLLILCFHPLEDELQEGRIFFFCFFVFLVPRHCLTHNRDSIMYWMNEWVNKWMRSSRILKWTDRCPLVLSLPQHISANDLSQKYIDRLLSPVLSILCGQSVRFNRELLGSLVEEMCSRLWLHVRV